jgi:peptidyl-prolyl cis-trans isomerase B (cyclophilin B)
VRYFLKKLLNKILLIFAVSIILIPSGNYVFAQEVEFNQFVDPIVIFETDLGEIIIEFFPNDAPNHVKNFITLSNQGFYDGTLFHRIIPGFMIQGGDPNTIGGASTTWGQGGPDEKVDAEFNSIKHNRGIVSMARSSDPNSAGSQFFIVHKNSNFLDGEYTVFGRIATDESFETLDKIAALEINSNDQPVFSSKTKITKTTISSAANIKNLIEYVDPERTGIDVIPPTGNQIFENKDLDISFSVPEGWLLQQPKENNPNAPDIAAVGPKSNGVNPVISLTIKNEVDKTIDELILEKNELLEEAISKNRLDIISQEKIKSNVVQTEAFGILQSNDNVFPIKFVEIMILLERTTYTFAYSSFSDDYEINLPKFNESVNSFKIISQEKTIMESLTEEFTEEGGGCLIATATYGSEMATEVQQLRELRDNQLLNTESGTVFITGFNEFYYSFSPTIADYERENPYFKEAVKLVITPMLSTLAIMENAETESEVLGLGLSVIALNLGMYLGIPAIVVIGIKRKI